MKLTRGLSTTQKLFFFLQGQMQRSLDDKFSQFEDGEFSPLAFLSFSLPFSLLSLSQVRIAILLELKSITESLARKITAMGSEKVRLHEEKI